jgi:hypothetical protein
MMPLRRALALPVALCLLALSLSPSCAGEREEAAANYIRDLFDTSMSPAAAPAKICPHVAQFGRFATGHVYHSLSATEQSRFQDGFCALTIEALRRLQRTYPALRLEMGELSQGPQGMLMAATTVKVPGQSWSWPVNWQIAPTGDGLRLADLRVLGISLGVFLHSLVRNTPEPPQATWMLDPWQQALNRAFPPQE